MFSWDHAIFYVVFLAQIFLISWYIPNQIIMRVKTVHEKYPPEQYPKLYPRSPDYYFLQLGTFKAITRGGLVLGFIILIALMFVVDHRSFADDGYISEAWPAFYAMVQMIPVMLLELFEFGQFKRMRELNASSTRTAELTPRRLFAYVSPALVGFALVLAFGVIGFDLWTGASGGELSLWLVIANAFMLTVAGIQLYGRKPDPHQSGTDRHKVLRASLQSVFLVSIVLSLFNIFAVFDQIYEIDYLDAIVISIFFQIVASMSVLYVLRSLKLDDIDFEVYKGDVKSA